VRASKQSWRKRRKEQRLQKLFASWFASLGGKARAKKLSPERRSEIARAAARARWGIKLEPEKED